MDKKDVILYFSLNTVVLLVGIILLLSNEKIGIGGSLIAVGITAYIVFWASYINTKKAKRDTILLSKVRRFGIEDIDERRLIIEQYAAVRKKANRSFDIMGFGLRNFIEDNYESFNDWTKSFDMRILLINPNSGFCSQRDYEEKDYQGKIHDDVIYATKKINELNNSKIILKWYNAIPVTNILRMDDTMWVGPYFIYERSRNAFVLRLRKGGLLYKQYFEHFGRIWNDPKLSCLPDLQDIK